MMRRTGWVTAFVVGLVAFGVQGCELPNGAHGRTPLTLGPIQPDTVLIGDTTVLTVEARDPAGRVVVDAPLDWQLVYHQYGTLLVLGSEQGPRLTVEGGLPGSVTVVVQASKLDPRFTSKPSTADVPIRDGPLTLTLLGVGRDTVLTARGELDIWAQAVAQHGRVADDGNFVATTDDRSVKFLSGWEGGLSLLANGFGTDTVVVSYSTCPNQCGDTLVVDVKPVATSIGCPGDHYWEDALDVPFQDSVVAVDKNGWDVPGVSFVWHLLDTSGILSVADSTSGTLIAHANGTTFVQVTSGSMTAQCAIFVNQEVSRFQVALAPYVAGLGTDALARFRGWDPGGTPIDSLLGLSQSWSSSDPSVATVVDASGEPDHTAQLQTQGYGVTTVDLTLTQCTQVGVTTCWDSIATAPLHVIPQPDSVRAYPQDGSTTLNGIGTTATWVGDIFLPDSTISAVPLIWTSLDPSVATIDTEGLVTAVSAGTARLVGSMGNVADTSVVTVVGSGP